jgi:RsmE family RNA methyltransferase
VIRLPVAIAELAPLIREQDAFWFGALAGTAIPLAQALAEVRARTPRRIGIMIGPEGDLTPEEAATLQAAGGVPVSFGPRTLRTETAALFALSVLNYELLISPVRMG